MNAQPLGQNAGLLHYSTFLVTVSADSLLIDVVDHSTDGEASRLSAMLNKLPGKDQKRIMNAIAALIE